MFFKMQLFHIVPVRKVLSIFSGILYPRLVFVRGYVFPGTPDHLFRRRISLVSFDQVTQVYLERRYQPFCVDTVVSTYITREKLVDRYAIDVAR